MNDEPGRNWRIFDEADKKLARFMRNVRRGILLTMILILATLSMDAVRNAVEVGIVVFTALSLSLFVLKGGCDDR